MLTSLLSALIWAPDKEIFRIGFLNDHPIVWYGLLFASGFVIGQRIMFYIYQQEGLPSRDIERMTVYMVVATVIGARLGHCLFYDFDYYVLQHPEKILMIWEGGLASHGGAIGILLALWLYARSSKTKDQSILFVLDRIVIVVALGGACIRMGNFVNNEMLGIETHSNAGVVFLTRTEDNIEAKFQQVEKVQARSADGEDLAPGRIPVALDIEFARQTAETDVDRILSSIEGTLKSNVSDSTANIYLPANMTMERTVEQQNNVYRATVKGYGIVRHPAQVYEAFYCVLIFFGLLWIWAKKRHQLREGVLFCLFLITLFSLRIVDEYFKLYQVAGEEKYLLNKGQYLSIPFIVLGIILLVYVYKKPTPFNPNRPPIPKVAKSKK